MEEVEVREAAARRAILRMFNVLFCRHYPVTIKVEAQA